MSIDYSSASQMYRRQKGQLTRAINSGDPATIEATVTRHVNEWEAAGLPWPDNWSRWQRAMNDILPWHQSVDILDLVER